MTRTRRPRPSGGTGGRSPGLAAGPADPAAVDLSIASGGPWEERFSYSRLRRVGPLAVTAGTTATVNGAVLHPGDAGAQARIAFRIALDALAGAGLAAERVIATRMYLTDRADTEAVGSVHGEVFKGVSPAATMVVVAGLVDPAMLVEVELVAWAG